MATSHLHQWGAQDTLQSVAAWWLARSGWQDRVTLEMQIQLANPLYPTTARIGSVSVPVQNRVYDWDDGRLVGAKIVIPFATTG